MPDRVRGFLQRHAGLDAYSLVLFLIFLALLFVGRLYPPLWIPAVVVLLYVLFRFFSRNHERRQVENARFLALTQSVSRWFKKRKSLRTDKEHLYFKCPNCGQPLRAPKRLGKIQISCRSCGTQFEKKT